MTTAVQGRSRAVPLLFTAFGTASVLLALALLFFRLRALNLLSWSVIVVMLGSGACLLWASRRQAR